MDLLEVSMGLRVINFRKDYYIKSNHRQVKMEKWMDGWMDGL